MRIHQRPDLTDGAVMEFITPCQVSGSGYQESIWVNEMEIGMVTDKNLGARKVHRS